MAYVDNDLIAHMHVMDYCRITSITLGDLRNTSAILVRIGFGTSLSATIVDYVRWSYQL